MLPTLRVTEANGDSWDDPAEEVLTRLVAELTAEHNFVVVERHDQATTWQYYIQVLLQDDATYRVEFRDGTERSHSYAQVSERDTVTAVMLAWARNEPGWRQALPWQLLNPSL